MSIGFIGMGRMGSAIAAGLRERGWEGRLSATDPAASESGFRAPPGVELLTSVSAVEERSELILICVKPGLVQAVCAELGGGKKYGSIAAGVSLGQIQGWIRGVERGQLARVMPNLSATIAQSVSAVYCEDTTLRDQVLEVFDGLGFVLPVADETLMHAVTGLSGSGPAFVFAFIQALAEGGIAEGLPYEQALALASHTVRGAADLLIQSAEHPSVLRNRVTSPGGTTIAGLEALEQAGFGAGTMSAVRAAARRSRELGE